VPTAATMASSPLRLRERARDVSTPVAETCSLSRVQGRTGHVDASGRSPLPLAGEGWGEGADSGRAACGNHFPAFNRARSMSTNRHGCERKLSFL